jgi:phosphoribosyl 1,2-cyclic phosphodiesterase
MRCFSVSSGSNGNCICVESDHVRLLFDAGISGKQTADRLARRGRDIRRVDAVIISHDHSDHVRCSGILARKFGLPVYMTARTHEAAERYSPLGTFGDLRFFDPSKPLVFGDLTVHCLPTPHDAAEPLAFVVTDGQSRLGVLTDLGNVFGGLTELMAGLDGAFLESNYDPDMLRNGPYPAFLKARIVGEHGHISNFEAAELVARQGERLQWVALPHLSEQNNTPDLAYRTHCQIAGRRRPVHVSPRYDVGKELRVE